MPTTAEDFKALAERRIREAEILYAGYEFAGAYYLAGYAIECALKACIAKQTRAGDFPPSPKDVANDYHIHDLKKLLKTAGLHDQKERKSATDPDFETYWGVVSKWSERVRYEKERSGSDAKDIILAITNPTSGVLPWIRGFW